MYVEEIKSRHKNKIYRSFLIRESYKVKGKVKHRTIANISRMHPAHIAQIKAMLSGKGEFISNKELEISDSREYGASFAFLELAKRLGLDKIILFAPRAVAGRCNGDDCRQNSLSGKQASLEQSLHGFRAMGIMRA